MNKKFLGKTGILLCALLYSSNITTFANTPFPSNITNTYNNNLIANNPSPRLNDIFTVKANQNSWTLLYTTNNLLDENLKITPIGFGEGITGVDIFVSWKTDSQTWENVQIDETKMVTLYWNSNDYRVYVKTRGEDGNVVLRLNDRGQ